MADVSATVRALEDAGATVISSPTPGPHEFRAVLADPCGDAFIVYGPP
ncbi:VOC family protein [Amycolatopsis pithecellobii]|nr:VOC family protein [Amycolatopsis pithecellobii]